jgi:hypothetical protein
VAGALGEHPRDRGTVAVRDGGVRAALERPAGGAQAKAGSASPPERTVSSKPPTCANASRLTAALAVCANGHASSASVISWLIEDFRKA